MAVKLGMTFTAIIPTLILIPPSRVKIAGKNEGQEMGGVDISDQSSPIFFCSGSEEFPPRPGYYR